MNLYLLEQDVNRGYDTYDSCVVVAESEDDAKLITPDGGWSDDFLSAWAYDPEDVIVTCLGVADNSLEEGTIVCSSFNAG